MLDLRPGDPGAINDQPATDGFGRQGEAFLGLTRFDERTQDRVGTRPLHPFLGLPLTGQREHLDLPTFGQIPIEDVRQGTPDHLAPQGFRERLLIGVAEVFGMADQFVPLIQRDEGDSLDVRGSRRAAGPVGGHAADIERGCRRRHVLPIELVRIRVVELVLDGRDPWLRDSIQRLGPGGLQGLGRVRQLPSDDLGQRVEPILRIVVQVNILCICPRLGGELGAEIDHQDFLVGVPLQELACEGAADGPAADDQYIRMNVLGATMPQVTIPQSFFLGQIMLLHEASP